MVNGNLDMGIVEAKARLAFQYFGGAVVASLIWLGDKLDIYRTMAGAGPLTADELAARLNLHPRWMQEWLANQAAANLIEYRGGGRFELSPEAALVLADENTPASAIGAFESFPQQFAQTASLPESFRTGRGRSYDEGGEAVARFVERMFAPWYRSSLVAEALPKLGFTETLAAGAKVADVGCGTGTALLLMAAAFPHSDFHGYDNSANALRLGEENKRTAGVANVTFHNPDHDPLPEEPAFDLITTFDCLHDMPRPDIVARAIRGAIKPEGTWFIVDIAGGETLEENLERPMAALLYGASLMTCLSSSMSTADGGGYGTLGLPAGRMKQIVTDAGFSEFGPAPGMEHPLNAYYIARP